MGRFLCSGRGHHIPPCGNYTAEIPGNCGEGPPEPWCHCSGWDCPDCAIAAELISIIETLEAAAA